MRSILPGMVREKVSAWLLPPEFFFQGFVPSEVFDPNKVSLTDIVCTEHKKL